jgi:hypothetical protein
MSLSYTRSWVQSPTTPKRGRGKEAKKEQSPDLPAAFAGWMKGFLTKGNQVN